MTEEWCFDSWWTKKYFLLRQVQIGSGPNQPDIQLVHRGSFLGVQRPEFDLKHSSLTSAEVKNEWIYTVTPTYTVILCTLTALPFGNTVLSVNSATTTSDCIKYVTYRSAWYIGQYDISVSMTSRVPIVVIHRQATGFLYRFPTFTTHHNVSPSLP